MSLERVFFRVCVNNDQTGTLAIDCRISSYTRNYKHMRKTKAQIRRATSQGRLITTFVIFSLHYENRPIQYTVIFHGCKNDYFRMKNCDIFLIFAQVHGRTASLTEAVLTSPHSLCFRAKIRK